MKKYFLVIPLFLGLLLLFTPTDVRAVGVDLMIEKVEINPPNPQPGERATVTFWGKNIGTSSLTSGQGIDNVLVSIGDFAIEGGQSAWMVGASPSPTISTPLKPGDVFTYAYTGSFYGAGNKTLSFMVDNANELVETNENNNSFVKIINILSIGDLIKTATNSAVYYYGSDAKRHLFPNEVTFWTWHVGSWRDQLVKVISQSEFDAISVGNNVTARPGENFIRFDNSNNIYAVKPGGELCFVDTAYANKQKIKKIKIQSGFQSDYKESLDCSLNDYTTAENVPEGSIFKYENGTQTFYMSNDGIRSITTANGWNNNLMNINSVLVVKMPASGTTLPIRPSITAKEEMFGIDYEIKNRNSQSLNPALYDRMRPCNVANGMGKQNSSDGYNWSTCVATTCNSGYHLSNGNCVANAVSITSHDLWLIFDKYKNYFRDHNANGINSLIYGQKFNDCTEDTEECKQFFALIDFSYNEMSKYNESDFSLSWIDDKQAILATPLKKGTDNYSRIYMFFVKDSSNYKLLLISSPVWHYGLDSYEINQQKLNEMSLDSDSDGLTDQDERCDFIPSSMCVLTDSHNRDTDGDGFWDGIDKEIDKIK